MAIAFYGISFFRQNFLVPVDFASVIILAGASCYTVGSLIVGRLVNRFKRKSLIVLTDLLVGILTISFVIAPNLWISLALNFLGAFFSGMESSAANSLTLEQVPRFRGTMTSINSAAISLGNALGAAIGGFVLVLINYQAVGIALGGMAIIAALIFRVLAVDPHSPKP
jgi:SHS family lactate transporter-like MFS transporter